MDNVTLIRVVSGILALCVLFIIISRRKRMAGMKRPGAKR